MSIDGASTSASESLHWMEWKVVLPRAKALEYELDHGGTSFVLKDVANDIGMHESTVSRATAGKYVHTPQGTFELNVQIPLMARNLLQSIGLLASASRLLAARQEIIAELEKAKADYLGATSGSSF